MDAEVLGETNTNALYNLTDSLGLFHSANVYTVYDWLVQIYQGKKEPSRNEFDQDFNAFLLEEKRTGNITEEQMQQYKNDSRQKVQFEIRNMFTSGNRVTYGRVTTFCPVLMEEDFINTVEKMAVTAEKLPMPSIRCAVWIILHSIMMSCFPIRIAESIRNGSKGDSAGCDSDAKCRNPYPDVAGDIRCQD